MRKLILRMNLTLDGVAAGENNEPIDGVDLSDPDSWRTIFDTLQTVDAMLVGGTSHRDYLNYWQSVLANPKADPNEKKFAEIAARTRHYVVSRTVRTVEWPNASVLPGGVAGISDLKNGPGQDILMWGGPTSASAAADAGVIDEYHLEIHPVIAGRGKKLFDNVSTKQSVRHLSTEVYPSGVILHKHARA